MIISAMAMTTTIIVTISIGVGDIIFMPLIVSVITNYREYGERRAQGLGFRAEGPLKDSLASWYCDYYCYSSYNLYSFRE